MLALLHVINVCCRQCFAHETGWAMNITAFKLGKSQRVREKSLSLGIKRTTEWIGSETLAQCAMWRFNSITFRVVKQKIVWCVEPRINYFLLWFSLIRLCIFIHICLNYKLSHILYCIKLPCLHIKWWRWSWCSKVAGKESRFSLVIY